APLTAPTLSLHDALPICGPAVSVLRRAEKILRAEQAPSLIATSELLPGGLSARQRTLAAALTTAPATVELSWRQIQNHPLTTARSEEHTSELQSRFDLVC